MKINHLTVSLSTPEIFNSITRQKSEVMRSSRELTNFLENQNSATVRAANELAKSLIWQESEAMRSIREMNSSLIHRTSIATELAKSFNWRESEVMRSAREIGSALVNQASIAAKMAELTSSYLQQESASIRLAREIANTSILDKIAPNNSLFESHQSDLAKQFRDMIEQHNSVFSSTYKNISDISASSTIRALFELENSPFKSALSIIDLQKHEASINGIDLDNNNIQAQSTLDEVEDFNLLTPETQKLLYHLYHAYILPILLGIITTFIYEHYIATQNDFKNTNSPREVKSLSRKSDGALNKNILINYRAITANNLRVREESSMKSKVITTLPLGTLVEVLDKSNRTWLFIEVELGNELYRGYINRKYTTSFK